MLAIFTGNISLFFTRLHTVKHFLSRKPTLDSLSRKSIYFRTYYDICRQAFSLIITSIFSLMILSHLLCSCSATDKEQLGKNPYERASNPNEIDNVIDNGIICHISNGLPYTKVELGDWESVSSCPVFWKRGDRIAILCDDGTRSSYITESDKTQEARFRYDEDLPGNNRLSISEKYVALYPEENWRADGSLLLPSVQTNAPNSGKNIFFPMVAVSSGTRAFDFSGVCGIIRLKCLTSTGATTDTNTESVRSLESDIMDNIGLNGSVKYPKKSNAEISDATTVLTVKEVALYASQDIGNVRIHYSDNLAEEADDAAATNVIKLELPGETTLTEDGTDLLFTVKPGEYSGIKFQLALSDGRFLIYPVPDGLCVSKNVMTSYAIPVEAFYLSDKSVPDLGLADESLLSLDYTFSRSEVETDVPVNSGKFKVNSYRRHTFSNGTQWLSDVDMNASFSTDGGNTFSDAIPSALSAFEINYISANLSSENKAAANSCSINNTITGSRATAGNLNFKRADELRSTSEKPKMHLLSEDKESSVSGQSNKTGLYEITYTLAEEADSCVVRLTQRVSGKDIIVTLK